ncbi:MAG: hypothetical protein IV100_25295 [Myxococcales bacterium]|nr:hypothetical protein [Myxococcales bacterium]
MHTFILAHMLMSKGTYPPRLWAQAYAVGPRCGLVTTNNAETFNASLSASGARQAPLRSALMTILSLASKQYRDLQQIVLSGDLDGDDVNKQVAKAMRPAYGQLGERFLVAQKAAGQDVVSITKQPDVNAYDVKLRNNTSVVVSVVDYTCTWGWPQTMGTPCAHAIYVANNNPSMLRCFFAHGLRYEQLRAAFDFQLVDPSIDLATLEKRNLVKLLPTKADGTAIGSEKPGRGRPKSDKRIPSVGEDTGGAVRRASRAPTAAAASATAATASSSTAVAATASSSTATLTAPPKKRRTVSCATCGNVGHNKASCTEKCAACGKSGHSKAMCSEKPQ